MIELTGREPAAVSRQQAAVPCPALQKVTVLVSDEME